MAIGRLPLRFFCAAREHGAERPDLPLWGLRPEVVWTLDIQIFVDPLILCVDALEMKSSHCRCLHTQPFPCFRPCRMHLGIVLHGEHLESIQLMQDNAGTKEICKIEKDLCPVPPVPAQGQTARDQRPQRRFPTFELDEF